MLNVLPQKNPRHKTNLLNKSKHRQHWSICSHSAHCHTAMRKRDENQRSWKLCFQLRFLSPPPALFLKNLCNLARINKSKLKPNNSKPIACRQKVKKSCNVLFYIIEVTGWNRINCSCVFSSVNISSKCVIGCGVGGVGVGKYPGLA